MNDEDGFPEILIAYRPPHRKEPSGRMIPLSRNVVRNTILISQAGKGVVRFQPSWHVVTIMDLLRAGF